MSRDHWRLTTNGAYRLGTGSLGKIELLILQKIDTLHMPMYVQRVRPEGVVVIVHPDRRITFSLAGAPITRDEASHYGWPELLTMSLVRAFYPQAKEPSTDD